MFGIVHCNESIVARQNTDSDLYFVRILVKNWLWPIITFFGVAGNILAIIVLTKRRMIMSSTNNYLVALALVDIAYLFLTLIINTLQNPCFTNTSLADIVLTICRPIADFSSNSSVWLTVTFTVERWVAITYPLQSRTWCTVYRARKIIISVIFASLICTLPSAFETKLVRVDERKNHSNKIIYINRIKATSTALGNSPLYHQIYFNFVTFVFIWIPLVLLVIFNTILISYVHHSKKSKHHNREGIELRRHNRGNQGEQRKTTIMLIAVVIVFTVCQIPQAISLTVQSFFPTIAQTSKVLIYNNFANCLVAVNASINFLLYCCFSERFRSTFRSSFTFLSKYCAHYIQPSWKTKSSNHHHHQPTHSNSLENMSVTNQSNYSLLPNQINTGMSTLSLESNMKYSYIHNQKQSLTNEYKEQYTYSRLPISAAKLKLLIYNNTPKDKRLSRIIESCPNSPRQSQMNPIRQLSTSNVSTTVDRILKIPSEPTISPPQTSSFAFSESNRPLLKKSHSLTDDHRAREAISLKRYFSHSAIVHCTSLPVSV